MEINLVLCLPREAVSVPVTRQVLDGCLETLGVTPDTRADIALALSEACANVIQHAGPGEEYEVQVSARDRRCVIDVVNTGTSGPAPRSGADGASLPAAGQEAAAEPLAAPVLTDDPVPVTAEHGRGLKIINAVMDTMRLTGNGPQGTTVHFEKELAWLPGAAGRHLLAAEEER